MRSRIIAILSLFLVAACSGTEGVASPHRAVPVSMGELSSQLSWVGALHHTAMQEALHDTAATSLAGRGPLSKTCAAQIVYMRRYLPLIEGAVRLRSSSADRAGVVHHASIASVASLAPRVGTCRASATRPQARSTAEAFGVALADSVATSRSLPEALALIDSRLESAASYPGASADEVERMAAIAVLARASAIEWFTYFAAHPGVRHGASPGLVAMSDIDGCVAGMSDGGIIGCVLGGIGGSIWGW